MTAHREPTPVLERRWRGQLLCQKSYREALLGDFYREYSAWDGGALPPVTFRVSLARVIAELAELRGESFLSRARVRDRAVNYAKVSPGVRFEITRHLHAFDGRHPMTRLVEIWSFNMEALRYHRESVREWSAMGDPE